MRGGGAGREIAIAPTLLAAQRADALHVAENEGLATSQIVLVDAECRQHLRQLIGGMRPLADQRLQIGGRHPQIARDPAEIGGVHLAHFPELAPVLQPVAGLIIFGSSSRRIGQVQVGIRIRVSFARQTRNFAIDRTLIISFAQGR